MGDRAEGQARVLQCVYVCEWRRERKREGVGFDFESFKWDEEQMAPFYGGKQRQAVHVATE